MLRWLIVLLPCLAASQPLPGTKPLDWSGDSAELIVSGIHRYLDRYQRPASGTSRERLAYILGVNKDERVAPRMELVTDALSDGVAGQTASYTVKRVRWPWAEGIFAEGLLLTPKTKPAAFVVALGDADWTPEMLMGAEPGVPETAQFARRLAENGAMVVVPLLMDRKSTYSGVPAFRMTNMPHREFLWRQLYPLGRHTIGVEVQKTLAALDWLETQAGGTPLRVAGYGEGGLIALDAAALDTRIEGVVVSGYFGPRDELWKEPVYRDVWGLLPDYRDAELARLIAPRRLIVEAAPGPVVDGPPAETKERRGASPHGRLQPVSYGEVEREVNRVNGVKPKLIRATLPGSDTAISVLLQKSRLATEGAAPRLTNHDNATRFERQFQQIITYARRVIHQSDKVRSTLWSAGDRTSAEQWTESTKALRDRVWNDMIGRLPAASLLPNPRTRLLYDEPDMRIFELLLDVWPEVNAFGYLLVPKNIKAGERRAAVVCQHGLEGRPKNVADPKLNDPTYGQFAVKLAREGFVTFAPQNPYVLGDRFRQINRKAHPYQLTQFAFIAGQHQRILEWLGSLDFVDSKRIGFYGLSYGGFTAQRIPALLDGYALSINSGNFNEWVWKVASLDAPFTYPLTGEYDIPEFNFANLVNYFELSTLIFPRPFMVERGHKDGVSIDEWVAYEYAKVFRFYSQMKLGDRTTIEYFDGPHQIHGVGTVEFLKKHLRQ